MMSLKLRAVAVCAAFAGLIAMIAVPAYALLVRPIVIDLSSSGSASSSSVEVVNDRNVPVTVEVTVSNLSLPEQGAPTLSPTDGKDFLIFPTIAKLEPGGRQVFRVRYVGDASPAKSRLFMLSSSELPISLADSSAKAEIKVLYSINSILTVRPPKATSDIKIADVRPGTNDKGEQGLRVTFENDGNSHGYVGAASMTLTSGSWRKALDANAMGKAFGLGLVPAQSKRILFLAVPDAPSSGISGTLKPAAA